MDEILASIRRIIESGDDRSAPVPPVAGAATASEEARGGVEAASPTFARSPSFTLPPAAARVVPLTERIAAARAADGEEGRWLPAAEPANQTVAHSGRKASTQSRSLRVDPAARIETVPISQPLPETTKSVDRWTREFEDVDTWPVLREEPRSDEIAAAEPEPVREAEEPATVAPSRDNSLDDDDFAMDFDEADFVEALDRNSPVAGLRDSESLASLTPAPSDPVRAPWPAPAVSASSQGHAATASAAALSSVATPVEATPAQPAALANGARSSDPQPSCEPASVMRETSALMSHQAGAEVAAAFDDLARAIRDGQMKSMEDMAREMLRPMLQDWLDDNLPRLVERLVREEIERVSRGGRR